MLIFPFYAIMFSERSHLSTASISALFALWTLVALLSEIPTGIVADKFSRKHALVAGSLLQALGFGLWIVWPSFYGYALGFAVWGIGYAFGSGAFQAYIYDELKHRQQEKLFTKIYTRSQSMNLLGMIAAFLVSTAIGPQYTTLLVASIVVSLIAAGIALAFPADRKVARGSTTHVILLKTAAKEVYKSPILLRLTITIGVVGAFLATMDEFIPLYYSEVGVPTKYVPLLLATGLSLSAIIAWNAHRFEHRKMTFGLLLIGVAGLLLASTSFLSMVPAAFGILMFMRLTSLSSLLYESSLQQYIASDMRATVSSIPEFIAEILCIVILVFYGLIAHWYGDFASIRFVGGLIIIAALFLALLWRKHRTLRLSKPEVAVGKETSKLGLSA